MATSATATSWKQITAIDFSFDSTCLPKYKRLIPFLNEQASDLIDGDDLDSLFSDDTWTDFTTERPHNVDAVQYLFSLILDRIVDTIYRYNNNCLLNTKPHRIPGLLLQCTLSYVNPVTGFRRPLCSVNDLRELFEATCKANKSSAYVKLSTRHLHFRKGWISNNFDDISILSGIISSRRVICSVTKLVNNNYGTKRLRDC